jgi:hypothetical protein
MTRFKEWLINEAAIGPQNIRYDTQGRPNFRVSIRNQGQIIGLEILQGSNYKYAGDMVSDDFGDENLLKGYKIYNWHADMPQGAGYGPMFYDIALEIATKNGGYLAPSTLLNRFKNIHDAKERKGHGGGDATDAAESVYKFIYERRGDVEKVQPNIVLANEPDQAEKPWMYEFYQKKPTVLPQLIEMNRKGRPVLVSGVGIQAEPIIDMNFNAMRQKEQPQQNQPTQAPKQPQFHGFQMGDTKTWQQRQKHLNSMGIDTAEWSRAEIMRGVKNKD